MATPNVRGLSAPVAFMLCAGLPACGGNEGDGGGDDGQEDAADSTPEVGDESGTGGDGEASSGGAGGTGEAPPLELTEDLCDDPSNLEALGEALGGAGDPPSYGDINIAQVMRMLAAPTEGPFYMVNLIRFRDEAVYPDGRDTDLTGREANDLYSPTEFLEAIGARIMFVGDVAGTTLGEDGLWHQVAIVEYPCPLALFAMSAHPEFQARSIHKDAGVERSTVIVTHLLPTDEEDPGESPFPPTADDPSFDWVQLIRHRESAEYPRGADEPDRTGEEAMEQYVDALAQARAVVGASLTARLEVEGVFIGDGREWDVVWIDALPSQAAFEALTSDPAVVEAELHRDAALEDGYGLQVPAPINGF